MSYDQRGPDEDDDDRPHYDPDSFEEGGYPLYGESWHSESSSGESVVEDTVEERDPYDESPSHGTDVIEDTINEVGKFLENPIGYLFGDW